MNSKHIRYFLVLFEELHFGRTAKLCKISQPTLSAAMKKLERNVGGALFARRPECKPTALAVGLRPHFEKIVAAFEMVEREVKRFHKN
jgi:DNA-binding transcriptional LysR family regulator